MMPSWSRSHCTALPATNALPSSAYVVLPPMLHATVVSRPCLDGTASLPVLTSKKAPVPYVHLASPGRKHVCPKSAAC
jgi:hypothetical protein